VPDDYPAMKEHRLKRPALGMFACYAVLVWRFFFD
jgi:hypothetical protein